MTFGANLVLTIDYKNKTFIKAAASNINIEVH